jgi:hypothetical protein
MAHARRTTPSTHAIPRAASSHAWPGSNADQAASSAHADIAVVSAELLPSDSNAAVYSSAIIHGCRANLDAAAKEFSMSVKEIDSESIDGWVKSGNAVWRSKANISMSSTVHAVSHASLSN